jgi:hypothetical protein
MPSITRSTARSTDTTAARSTPRSTTTRTASRSAAGAADAGSPRAPEAARAAGRESDSGRPDDGRGAGRASTGTHGLVICVKSVRDTVEDGAEPKLSAARAVELRFPGPGPVASVAALFERAPIS